MIWRQIKVVILNFIPITGPYDCTCLYIIMARFRRIFVCILVLDYMLLYQIGDRPALAMYRYLNDRIFTVELTFLRLKSVMSSIVLHKETIYSFSCIQSLMENCDAIYSRSCFYFLKQIMECIFERQRDLTQIHWIVEM